MNRRVLRGPLSGDQDALAQVRRNRDAEFGGAFLDAAFFGGREAGGDAAGAVGRGFLLWRERGTGLLHGGGENLTEVRTLGGAGFPPDR